MKATITMIVVAVLLAVATLVADAVLNGDARTFTPAERAWLQAERSRGYFVNDSTYKHCDGRGYWATFRATGNWEAHEKSWCWWYQMPVEPTPRWTPQSPAPGM